MARILVMGTIAFDHVIRLKAPLIAGGHQNGIDRGSRLGGGGANAAVALARAGDTALLVSALGNDLAGEALKGELLALGVDLSLTLRLEDDSSRSIVMTDTMGERSIVNLQRLMESDPPWRILKADADALYVRSRQEGLASLLSKMADRMTVVAHVPPTAPASVPAQILVGSESDLDQAFLADPFAKGRTVSAGRLTWIVITRGSKGAEAFGPDGAHLTQPARQVDVVDSTGAGDAFAAGLTHALARHLPMPTALEIAVAWGTAATQYDGSAPGPGFPPLKAG
ncbi:MAG: hypothetical protein HQL43_01405 [Alphaproteobacteria bacterium]|nr:hypothetical protein [Alphaproteobacteria bacterium]